ncbi:hypothetical protein U27_02130 [Candidatus Vecturithrix granuli]|uniref:Glycosyltransferase 2-like domain-containing protein n=1 Tax=Vecturithrix granuli TaxID=1499967 RepID=A0A0S6W9X8_VECG1|nr:hypothetical protein U27_02130 [Candidatus Vecturithrix granuli]
MVELSSHIAWPKISITTPSYNQAAFLETTIQSILSQNYPNLEYIIIDGGSTDGSVDIIKKYAQHLHFWCSESDDGQYNAINKGFSLSSGEIMAWLNSDDMYFPWALKTVASIMAELPQVEWLTTLERGKWDWQGFCLQYYPVPGYSREAFLDGCYLPAMKEKDMGCIQQESTFWRRSLWNKIGGKIPLTFPLAADFNLWAQFYCHAELYATRSPLGGFRCQEDQRSSHIERYISEANKALDNIREILHWMPRNRGKLMEQWFASRYYSAKQVYRQHPDRPDGTWAIKEYRFL